ncbi:PREDICTED: uncharacterized protein LOC104586583 [Nelumbo nucifera]|uniref:Uncharacterized protein LOC104586583 n=1 Tax=Nelumbo nucifera TaxID=4432 RepID=A0A1U7YQ47_NELNU|nr:PREDICTED: uncharacterized protein LOC104586583 [Nelumbo nucifera]
MENQVARRMNLIMGHFAGNEELSASHVFPVNCSSSVNSVIQRRDNRLFFARQGSISQACFMRQVSNKQISGQGSLVQSGVPLSCSGSVNGNSSSDVSGVPIPMFSKPVKKEPELPNTADRQCAKQDCRLAAIEPPKFARPNEGLEGRKQFSSKYIRHNSRSNGNEWYPRMDVAEFGRNYIVRIELPGISANDIKVEVDDQNLVVMGKQSTQWWQVACGSGYPIAAYRRREMSQGPYQVVWPLPNDVNKDSVSAEFLDGVLQVTLPKL